MLFWQTHRARTVSGRNSRGLVQKENAVLHIAATRDGLRRRVTIETAIEFAAAVATKSAGHGACVRLTVGSGQRELLTSDGHGRGSCSTSRRIVKCEFHSDALTPAHTADRVLEIYTIVAFGALEWTFGGSDDGCVTEPEGYHNGA